MLPEIVVPCWGGITLMRQVWRSVESRSLSAASTFRPTSETAEGKGAMGNSPAMPSHEPDRVGVRLGRTTAGGGGRLVGDAPRDPGGRERFGSARASRGVDLRGTISFLAKARRGSPPLGGMMTQPGAGKLSNESCVIRRRNLSSLALHFRLSHRLLDLTRTLRVRQIFRRAGRATMAGSLEMDRGLVCWSTRLCSV